MTQISTYTKDGVAIRGFLVHPTDRENMTDNVILYMHGIDFNPVTKIPMLKDMANGLNCQVVCFNYRGYSYSDNVQPTDQGIKFDCQAMLDWVVENDMILGSNKYLMGKSFGVATALYLTELTSVQGLPAQ